MLCITLRVPPCDKLAVVCSRGSQQIVVPPTPISLFSSFAPDDGRRVSGWVWLHGCATSVCASLLTCRLFCAAVCSSSLFAAEGEESSGSSLATHPLPPAGGVLVLD